MPSLQVDLGKLRELNEVRERATALRTQGYAALRGIESIDPEGPRNRAIKPLGPYENWIGMGNKLESALLAKIKRQRHLLDVASTREQEDCSPTLKLQYEDFFPPEDDFSGDGSDAQSNKNLDRRVPVLLSAMVMQVLASRSEFALSEQTMLCYYRILIELHLAVRPDWAIGAARAGSSGSVSAFVTGECMRAVLTLEHAIANTAKFVHHTGELVDRFEPLRGMLLAVEGKLNETNPLKMWANSAVERMWMNWRTSVHPRHGDIAIPLEPPSENEPTIETVEAYLKGLPDALAEAVEKTCLAVEAAWRTIRKWESDTRRAERKRDEDDPDKKKVAQTAAARAKRHARDFGRLVINRALSHAARLKEIAAEDRNDLRKLLKNLENEFEHISREILRVLDPSKRYVEAVLDRALADAETRQFDAGELVFASAAFGAATGWKGSRAHLRRACDLLLATMPASGLLVTKVPFHSTRRGYKLFPTGCEMMRSLALVVERTGYEIEPEHVRLMVDAVDSKKLLSRDGRLAGWNFEGANNPDQPSVWVTAVTVLALERLVRMLDERINCIVLANFEVITPNKPQSSLRLGDLIYPDYGFAQHYHVEEGAKPIALRLGNMRAQLMRVPLNTSGEKKGQETRPIFSAVFYGPPATGKTTLAEALAFSSGVPLVRLSPFDLVVDPRGSDEPGTIQGRAQIVFEALSMLTRTVILFDEFETALANRSEEGKPAIASVVAGLLPKLVKLHDVALTQGLVYFLATNYRKRLDDAAIRRGRFDIHLPVFHPDPLSRTATLFYRLERVRAAARRKGCEDAKAWTGDAWQLDSSAAVRLLEIIAREANTSATALAQDVFRLPPWILNSEQEWPNEWKKDLPVFTYILENAPDLEEKKATPSFKVKASSDNENDLHEVEKEEKRWLDRFERAFQNSVVAAKKRIKDTSVPMTGALILQQCLDDSLTAASNRSS